ncbi:Hsp70 family protein [Kaistia dalseonensis]|uniref:Chaperone protein n=1 Tax=Kaistia dalseonensis TaxID=410840 RepID=A0ABU0H3N8_9HYPH|nr:Hsp70 family protein [Kaistia dalseonensis]MCX5494333.1 Hsp70 family protein [Kaistia dalseonensis]MDQ0436914.1 putative chaperone protein [Kaistia dalseonensis]
MAACGLDFGTSNTTLGIASAQPELVPLEGGDVTVPSAIFYARDAAPLVGRAAIRAYVDGNDGRLMRSLKSVLGNPLIDETTQVGRARVGFRSVIAHFIAVMKRRAEAASGHEIEAVVHGRPVHFVDGDAAGDSKAEDSLRKIAHEVGFSEISFQYEPIAAALDYERQVNAEEVALIADIGGGTSDFSIVRIGPERRGRAERVDDILANDGIRVGGTDFDKQLSLGTVMPLLGFGSGMKRAGLPVPSGYFHDLATWSTINRLYERGVMHQLQEVRRDAAHPELIARLIHVVDERGGHRLAIDVEGAKIALSDEPKVQLLLDWVERGLASAIDRETLVRQTENLAGRIADRIGDCLRDAGLKADQIDAVFLTGGSTRLAHVHAAILATVPEARVVDGDTFGSVGMGLTIEAANRYGRAA